MLGLAVMLEDVLFFVTDITFYQNRRSEAGRKLIERPKDIVDTSI